jgi:tRNA(Ile)-lysidine synthase
MELDRLRLLHPAMRRRVLRAAAEQIGCALNFDQTELLLAMCENRAGRRETLTAELWAERTPRELRLIRGRTGGPAELPEYEVPIPGQMTAKAFGLRLCTHVVSETAEQACAKLRVHRAGDRVRIRHSQGAKKIKELLERMQVPSDQRKDWPVLEWQGEIVWMRGAELQSSAGTASGLTVEMEELV